MSARAEEIAENLLHKHTTAYVFGGVYHIDSPLLLIKSIAKALEDYASERCAEAIAELREQKLTWAATAINDAYIEGAEMMREMAAKVAKTKFPQSKYDLTSISDIASKRACEEVADQIRALQLSPEKEDK